MKLVIRHICWNNRWKPINSANYMVTNYIIERIPPLASINQLVSMLKTVTLAMISHCHNYVGHVCVRYITGNIY